MCRGLFISVAIVLLVASGASAVDLIVPNESTHTATASESYGKIDIAGSLIIESTGNVVAVDRSLLDGVGAEITVNGGAILIDDRFDVGQGSDGSITMNGGTFTVTGTFKFPDDDGGVHRIYLNEGIMHSGDIQLYGVRDAIIYVGGGILRLDDVTPGSDEYDPAEWIEQGALLPAEGYDYVVIEYIAAGTYTEVRAVRSDPNIAWRPRPVDYAWDVPPDVNLTWSPGDRAASHDVYFGTNLADVNDANTTVTLEVYKGNWEPNLYEAGLLESVELGMTYYWRVDEVNETTEWKGRVWRFTVDKGKARNENPSDGSVSVPPDANVSWTPGPLAVWHDVYFGTDFKDVNDATDPNTLPGRGRWDVNSYNPPGDLDVYKTYYWRVDEVSGSTFVKGDVWSFIVAEPYINSIGMEFVYIPSGTFTMGSENGDFDEEPVHNVTISQPSYMSKFEVTNAQYEQFDPDHNSVDHRGFSYEADEAVIFVSWEDANAFCDWLSQQEGQAYRLPIEAEWEYACRAGTTTDYHTGNTLPVEYQNHAVETTGPYPVSLVVGQTPPNPWGLYDMHGNVEEWCYDWYGPYEANDQTDPVGQVNSDFKVARGGSHSTSIYYLRSANRMGTLPEDNHWLIGFRVVMAELPATEPLPEPPPELYQIDVNQSVPPDINQGPDPNTPYFDGPRTYIKISPGSYGPLFSEHNHDPGLTECPNGDLLAIWYTCAREKGRELAIAASRLRYGQDEWEPASLFWDGPDRNDHAPAMWTDETGKMYHFNGLAEAATWGALATILRTSTDNGVTWSRARLIIPEHGLRHMPIESVFRISGGAIVLPCDAALSSDPRGTAIWISEDDGQTWYDPGGTIAGIHAGVVELDDGHLLAFGRGGDIDGRMPKSISTDMGQTWTYSASEFPPIGGGQRPVLMRLREGPILFVSFTGSGGMVMSDVDGNERSVYGMFAALSYDEGETWSVNRLVTPGGPAHYLDGGGNTGWFVMDETHAEPKGYLAATQTPDGVVQLISSALHYRFNLAWLEEKHFLVVDDMESYNDTDNWIWETWLDGSANLTGSSLYLWIDPNYPIHGGEKSMLYYYDNNHPPIGPIVFEKYSEIERTFDDPCDWTADGVKALALYFYGDPDNDSNVTEQMYIGVEDSNNSYAEVRYGNGEEEDMNDIKKNEWQQWNIVLQDFNDGGADLANIKKVYIGFGDRDNPTPGGSGIVYFDDIRLCQRRCLLEYDVTADFTGDCTVDFEDLEMLTRDWLESEGIVAGVSPDSNGLLLWYKFDETAPNSIANDSSGRGYDGDVDGPDGGWDPCNGYHGGCRIFNDDTAVTVPTEVLSGVNEGITFSVWLKDAWRVDSDNVIFETGAGDFFLRADVPDTSGNVYWRAGYDSNDQMLWYSSGPSDWRDSWSHYAFVKDATEGTMMIYHNGSLVAEKSNASHSLAAVHNTPFDIGALIAHSNDYIGKMDDFKIYDYALSQAEIVGAATGGGDLFVPLPRPAIDLYEDGKVNFKDLTTLADNWLKESLWPPQP